MQGKDSLPCVLERCACVAAVAAVAWVGMGGGWNLGLAFAFIAFLRGLRGTGPSPFAHGWVFGEAYACPPIGDLLGVI